MIKTESMDYLKKFISTSKMTWVICLSEIFTEFSEMNPENHIEILKMSIAQNAYMLNKKFNNWKPSIQHLISNTCKNYQIQIVKY